MITKINTGELLFEGRDSGSNKSMNFVIIMLTAFICFFMFFAFIPVSGKSMENTIHDKQYCLVQRNWYDISRGDIVTINTSNTAKEHIIIKRVIGLGGDRILFMAGKDGKLVDLFVCKAGSKHFVKKDEPYIKEKMRNNLPNIYENTLVLPYRADFEAYVIDDIAEEYEEYIINVPKGYVYFLGDNRNVSNDSRHYGAMPISKVTSKVLAIVY